MKYIHILMACAAEPWALEKSKLITIANFLRFKALGGNYSAKETARITQKTEREIQRAEGNIAIIPVQGVIGERMNLLDDISGGTSTEMIGQQFRAVLNDNSVKAIVFDVNSPGGVARSVEELGREIYDARGIKPIVAQINTCAASAAYWLAVQADEVVVTPSGQAGSIGVYAIHDDISKMLEQEGIKETLVYSGRFKVLGNNLEPLSDEARSVMQERVDELAASFVREVARGRNTTLADVNERFGEGLMFNAAELLKRGMVDRVATMAQTLARFGVDVNPVLTRSRADASASLPPAAGDQAVQSRLNNWARRVNDNDVPAPSEFEDILRDAGVSKSQRARIASRLHAVLRSESGDEEATTTAVQNAIAPVSEALAALRSIVSHPKGD